MAREKQDWDAQLAAAKESGQPGAAAQVRAAAPKGTFSEPKAEKPEAEKPAAKKSGGKKPAAKK